MLKWLYPSLKAYEESLEKHWNSIEYHSTGAFLTRADGSWNDLNRLDSWSNLTYEHIMGIQKNEDLLLPSLREVIDVCKQADCPDKDKIFAEKYILFCLDKVFVETVGITYEEYVKYISD